MAQKVKLFSVYSFCLFTILIISMGGSRRVAAQVQAPYLNKGTGNKEKKFITHQQVRRGFNNSATRRVKRLGGRIK